MSEEDIENDSQKKLVSDFYEDVIIKRVRIPPRFEEVSRLWVRDAPFYFEFMIRFNFFEASGSEDFDTFAVNCMNSRINLYYNEQFLNGGCYFLKIDESTKRPIIKLDESGNPLLKDGDYVYETVLWEGLKNNPKIGNEVEAVLAHEILHLVLLTQERSLDDKKTWNIASDMIINDMISNMTIGGRNLPLPKGAHYFKDAVEKGYTGPKVTEPLYHWLLGQKSSMNELEFNRQFESIFDNHEILQDNDGLTESTLQHVLDNAKIRGYGNIAGSGLEFLKKLSNGAIVNWKRELRLSLSSSIHGYGNSYYESWSKKNRRGYPLPGKRRLENKIIVGIDTSGSISNNEIEQFFSEIESIVKDYSQLTIIQWDTIIQDINNKYKRGDWKDIKIKGRGGTSPQKVFDWMEEKKQTKNTLLMFTDGYFYEKLDTHGCNIIWCITNNISNPPEGKKTIRININEKKNFLKIN